MGPNTADQHKYAQEHAAKDNEFAQDRMAVAVVCPGVAAMVDIFLDLLSAELEIEKAAKCNAVANSLERSDGVMEEYHAGHDEENVFQDTGEGKDEGGGLADLSGNTLAVV